MEQAKAKKSMTSTILKWVQQRLESGVRIEGSGVFYSVEGFISAAERGKNLRICANWRGKEKEGSSAMRCEV